MLCYVMLCYVMLCYVKVVKGVIKTVTKYFFEDCKPIKADPQFYQCCEAIGYHYHGHLTVQWTWLGLHIYLGRSHESLFGFLSLLGDTEDT